MRILQVVPYFYPAWSYGGTPRVVYELSRQLVKLGEQVWVFTTDVLDEKSRITGNTNRQQEIKKEVEGIQVVYFPNISNWLAYNQKFFYSSLFRKFLKRLSKNFDVIHMHEYRTFLNLNISSYAKQHYIPYVLSAHGSLPAFIRKSFTKKVFDILYGRRILNSASKVIATSEKEEEQYKSLEISPGKIEIINNGIDIKAFAQLPLKGSFKNKYKILNKKVILFLGRLNRIKGLDFLLESFRVLSQRNKDAILVIAGADDGYGAELRRLIQKLNLRKKVLMIGLLEKGNKLSALQDADLLVYPSQYEIFGLVPFEALMCGTPVIISNSCGCEKILREANAATIINYGDTKQLAMKMEEVLADQKKANIMIKKGQEIINQKLSWDYIARRTLQLYKNVIHETTTIINKLHYP